MKITLLAVILSLAVFSSLAQSTYSIKGVTTDSASRTKLSPSVLILNAKDSIMRRFTYPADDGTFSVNGLPAGKFILLITYPEYADHIEKFTLDAEHPTHDFGTINMGTRSKELNEVTIKAETREIKIKGDTIEFNAKAYVVQPNAKVEDLLKQIPGIEIDKDGKITANGQPVPKVLVDGEEFFGDDPTLVTQNIRADMVSSVQLYDKKSDQATFTGVDDGVKTKTINIKLKEDKKNGLFGKVSAGDGTGDYFEGQALFNRFRAKEKFSAYLTTANDGKVGLGLSDNATLGTSGNNVQIGDNGGISIFFNGDEDALDSFDGTYNGNGLPMARAGGVHYDGKLNNDKASINANFKVGSIEVTGTQSVLTQSIVPGNDQNTNTQRTLDNFSFRQKFDVTYQTKLDTTSNLKLSADGTTKHITTDNNYLTVTTDDNGNLINRNIKRSTSNTDQSIFDISAFYTKKFKKVGRTLSWNVSEAYTKNQVTGYLYSDIFTPVNAKDSVTDQYKPSTTTSSVLNSNITYSEPITKYFTVLFNYGTGLNNSLANRESFNKSAGGVYNILDPVYSNNYKFNQLTNQFGAVFNYKKDKTLLNFGIKASDVDFKQIDQFTGNVYKRDFINWSPQARYQYQFSTSQALNINYSGYTTQPSIDQLQPIKVNTDPLNIAVGNPNLKPSFGNGFNVNYNSSQVLSRQSFFLFGNFSFTSDAIISNRTTDTTTGKSTIQSVNLVNHTPYNYNIIAQMRRRIKGTDIDVGLNLSTNGSASYSYSNNLLNKQSSTGYRVGLNMQKNELKKYSIAIQVGPGYSFNKFSLTPQSNNNAPTFNAGGFFTVYLPAKFILSSDISYYYAAKTQDIDAINRTIWNGSLSKTFLKDDHLKVSLAANNLLNQNPNAFRNVNPYAITQTTYNSIQRYFMLSVSWDFTQFGTVAAAKN